MGAENTILDEFVDNGNSGNVWRNFEYLSAAVDPVTSNVLEQSGVHEMFKGYVDPEYETPGQEKDRKDKEQEAKDKAAAEAQKVLDAQEKAKTDAANKIKDRQRRLRSGGGQSTIHSPLGTTEGIEYLGA